MTTTLQDIEAWYRRERTSSLAHHEVMEKYFLAHPRIQFIKELKTGSRIVDIGAGDGSLITFRDWPAPARKDLKFHAYALDKGALFDQFESYRIGDWNRNPPDFDGIQFDAIHASHFIEHVDKPESLITWAADNLAQDGRMYIEWPSPESVDLPPISACKARGINLMITRFDDDDTHQVLPDRDSFIEHAIAANFLIQKQGTIRIHSIEDDLMFHFKDAQDHFPAQAAYWSWTGWSQFLVLRRQ